MRDKLPCGVVQDLLPLVIDDVAGDESKTAVEDHLADCTECARLYEQLKQADPSPAADDLCDQHFLRAMKRTRRRGVTLRIAAAFMVLVILVVGITVACNPKTLLNISSEVPVSWMYNAHLVRTSQGFVLLQFTPSVKYRRYFGISRTQDTWRSNVSGDGTYRTIQYDYPLFARLLDLKLDVENNPSYPYHDGGDMVYLANGDWLVPINSIGTMHFDAVSNCIVIVKWHHAAENEMNSFAENGADVNENMQIAAVDPESRTISISLAGTDGQIEVYHSGHTIPLLDAESQKLANRMIEMNPELFILPGEVKPSDQPVGHIFTPATCVSPETCARCGLTVGGLGDHVWEPATCSALSTCSICGSTTGTYVRHHYINGRCVDCGFIHPSKQKDWMD